MKITGTILSLVIGVATISVVDVNAQRRSRDRGGDLEYADSRERHHTNERNRYADNGDNDRRDHRNWKDDHAHGNRNHDYDRHPDRRVVRHVHVHDRYCHRRPVIVHHYSRPRYIYYRDYDVYYDYSRNVYFSYSGRSWTMSSGIPVGMRHADMRTAKRYEVDYYDDDFTSYLNDGRPEYGRACDW